MELDWNILKPQERLTLQLRMLYERSGFRQYHMSRFEEYGLYQKNRSFLPSEQVITFTDLDGRLLALKPDVTLSIAKNAQVEPQGCGRYYYSENVYRPSQESHTFQEIRQIGLECIGAVDDGVTAQAVSLALQSLALSGRAFALEAGHMGFVAGLLDAVGAPESACPGLLTCIREKNKHELQKQAAEAGLSRQGAEALCRLSALSGSWEQVLEEAEPLALNAAMGAALRSCGGCAPPSRLRARRNTCGWTCLWSTTWNITTAWYCRGTSRERPGRCSRVGGMTPWPPGSVPVPGPSASPCTLTS